MTFNVQVMRGPLCGSNVGIELFQCPEDKRLDVVVSVFLRGIAEHGTQFPNVVIDIRRIQVQQIVHYGNNRRLLNLN